MHFFLILANLAYHSIIEVDPGFQKREGDGRADHMFFNLSKCSQKAPAGASKIIALLWQ